LKQELMSLCIRMHTGLFYPFICCHSSYSIRR